MFSKHRNNDDATQYTVHTEHIYIGTWTTKWCNRNTQTHFCSFLSICVYYIHVNFQIKTVHFGMRFIVSQLSDNQYISFALVFDVAYCHSLIDSKTMCALVVVIANGTAAFVFNISAVVTVRLSKH